MMQLYVIKEQIKRFYQKTSLFLNPIIKFFTAFIVFLMVNHRLGFSQRLSSIVIVLGLSVLCAFTPGTILVVLAMAYSLAHIYALSKILAALVLVIYIIIWCFFSKVTPHFGKILLAVPILYVLNIPYLVPIAAGLIVGPLAILPVACGVAVHYLMGVVREMSNVTMGMSLEEILNIVKTVLDSWLHNQNMYFAMAVFCAVVLVTYIIRKQQFNYAFEISIAAGAIVNILGFLIANLGFDVPINILAVFLGTLAAAVLVYIFWFFRLTLDHTAIERVQFEDDNYYYYVKAVPKIKVTAPEKNVKKINEKQ